MSPAARILVIRHGETASNAARVFQTPETPLSRRGVAQAEALAARLRAHPVGGVVASDFERAHHTARAVAAATGAPLESSTLLHERNFGDLRGTPYADVEGDPFRAGFTPPGGESWSDFHARVDRAWEWLIEVAERTDGELAVVTHGLVCGSLVERKLRLPAGAASPRGFANTSLTIAGAAPPFAVERLACVEHLDADLLPGGPGGGRA